MGKDRNEQRFFDHLSVIVEKQGERKHGEKEPAETGRDLWAEAHPNG